MGRDRQGRIVCALQLRRANRPRPVGGLAMPTRFQIPSLATTSQADRPGQDPVSADSDSASAAVDLDGGFRRQGERSLQEFARLPGEPSRILTSFRPENEVIHVTHVSTGRSNVFKQETIQRDRR